jgi:hypothetical protein
LLLRHEMLLSDRSRKVYQNLVAAKEWVFEIIRDIEND